VRMSVTIAAALSMMVGPVLHGQKPLSNVDLSCVDSLELPTRGLLAAGAGHSGVVHAVARIGNEGRLSSLRLEGGNPGLRGEVRVAMNLSRFATKCRDRTMEFVFAFTLEGPPNDSILPPGVRFVPPNRFELVFRQIKPNYDPAPPKD
jgi:hypothetical protein